VTSRALLYSASCLLYSPPMTIELSELKEKATTLEGRLTSFGRYL
jgi:hypothetical protein